MQRGYPPTPPLSGRQSRGGSLAWRELSQLEGEGSRQTAPRFDGRGGRDQGPDGGERAHRFHRRFQGALVPLDARHLRARKPPREQGFREVPPGGLEPPARCLEGSRSVQLSYGGLGRG
jgi:hypothetical protein